MWERRSYNDGTSLRCTVKFKGYIPQWPNILALGVEWDDPSRGRHSGELNGIQYFQCRVPGAGSFIKATRSFEPPKTFEEAIANKYLQWEDFEEIQISDKKRVETVGLEKIYQHQSQLDVIESLSVEACLVNRFNPATPYPLNNLVRLDLSNNLIADFGALLTAVSRYPTLRTLRLNSNRFDFSLPFNSVPQCSNITELDMGFTMVEDSEVSIFLPFFTGLTQICLAHNKLQNIPQNLPPTLVSIDLAANPLSSIKGIPSSIQAIYLSQTNISHISSEDYVPPIIDLRDTKIVDWQDISLLGAQKVSNLYLNHAINDQKIQQLRPFIITRCPYLIKLDGTLVSTAERADAELYTLNCVASKRHPAVPGNIWESLIKKYGQPVVPPDKSIRARLLYFYIDSDPNPLRIVKDAPVYRLHWLVANAKGKTPANLQIKGITDIPISENDTYTSLTEVGDLLNDGDKVITY